MPQCLCATVAKGKPGIEFGKYKPGGQRDRIRFIDKGS
jgi:hypothetical protein